MVPYLSISSFIHSVKHRHSFYATIKIVDPRTGLFFIPSARRYGMSTSAHEHVELTKDERQDKLRVRTVLLVMGIVLLALNLRACITAVGPLVPAIRGTTGLSNVLAGLLTALPLLTFGAISPLAPRLARRWGMEAMLLASLVGLTAGILLRSLPSPGLLFLGTALLGAAIAISNVLLPALIKRDFPRHIGLMTGIYSTLLGVSGALADGVSIPLAQGARLGWDGSLGFWALPAALTALIWLPLLRTQTRPDAAQASGMPGRRLWRSPLAWQVTFFMGLQSLAFYIVVAWFPVIFQSKGLSASTAGWMLSLVQFVGVLGSFLTPLLAARMRSQRVLVAAVVLLSLVAYAGILSSANGLILLWCVLLGLALGAYLSLALLFFILRTPDTRTASDLSGMAQSIGYLLAATGPLLFGWLHDLTNDWTVPLLALCGITLVLLAIGMGAGRNKIVTLKMGEE
jgi:CP family cyanate transporter-like MFS transporter